MELSKQIEEIEHSFGDRKKLISRLTCYELDKGQDSAMHDTYDGGQGGQANSLGPGTPLGGIYEAPRDETEESYNSRQNGAFVLD